MSELSKNQDPNKSLYQPDEDVEIITPGKKTYVEQLLSNINSMTKEERIRGIIIASLAITLAIFHLYTSVFGMLSSWLHRAVHVGFILCLAFMLKQIGKKKYSKIILDYIPFLLSVALLIYMIVQYPGVEYRQGAPNQVDMFFGTLIIILLLEATRRVCGKVMTIIAIFFLFYIFIGPYLPGLWGHNGFSYKKVIDEMYMSTRAIFGAPIYTSSTVLVLFVLFGAFLGRSGGSKTFIDLASAIAGHRNGGPALTAVISSAAIGTITGTGTANVTITGTYTIPLMKKVGYKPAFAGAVEAVASQGGQIMPPIMGASAFIMAEYLGIPYYQIALGAAIPALFYFLACGLSVVLEAKKQNLPTIPKDKLPKTKDVLKEGWYNFSPLLLIIYLLVSGKSPMMAGFYGVVLTIAISFIKKETRLTLATFLGALEEGIRSMTTVALACSTAGIIVGAVSLTGIGMRFSRLAIAASGGHLIILLFFTMIASIILGMGLPTVSCYVLLSVLTAPALVKMGVAPFAAHMFVFYFGIVSGLTPPVAITSYTAAGIAGSSPFETGWESMKLAVGGFIIPYLFVYNPALLMIGSGMEILTSALSTLIGCFCFVAAVNGYLVIKMNTFQRLALLIATLLVFKIGLNSDLIGIAILLSIVAYNKSKKNKSEKLVV